MSQHPSLRVKAAGKKHRNVLKRYERIKKLQESEKWAPDKNSVFNLPKVKSQKLKAKGKSAKQEEAEAAAEGAAAPAAAEAKPAAKPAAKPSGGKA
ncbi:MAG: small basic protein [Candidatus Omnitrophica bacterium]|nr:small basic protein [Candidatus Omnitrophota bacterium]